MTSVNSAVTADDVTPASPKIQSKEWQITLLLPTPVADLLLLLLGSWLTAPLW